MARPKTCFYCESPADLTVPSMIAYCAQCWSEEHPNVKARMSADYERGLTLVQGIISQAQRLNERRSV